MPLPLVSTCKFVGTVSVGILTGLSYTISSAALPALLTLPSASSASGAVSQLVGRAKQNRRVLSAIAWAAYSAAFLFSPARARHPYLLWTGLVVFAADPGVAKVEKLLSKSSSSRNHGSGSSNSSTNHGNGHSYGEDTVLISKESVEAVSGSGPGSASSSSNGTAEDSINGEATHKAVERLRRTELTRLGVYGLGFLMGVVGIWGDAY